MPDARKTLDQLDDVTDFSLNSLLHTKEVSDNSDRKATVQDLVGLIPDPAETLVPTDGVSYDDTLDKIVIKDDSESGVIRALPASVVLNAAGIPTISGDELSGDYNIGSLQFRWGQDTSTTTGAQAFTFSAPFSNSCAGVFTNKVGEAGSNLDSNVLSVTIFDEDGFTIDRANGIGGNKSFVYFAIGY